MPTITDDNVHYNSIRKALANGNAAVMVGAGFSRNAENGDQLAMWRDVAKELWRELNPSSNELNDFSASMVTQLGEQYSRVFSKPALEELLKRLIPDNRVRPGALHNQLLQLPWSEIFTTNYDTLLERASEEIIDRAHYTVICREDIPQSKILNRRRIVKLHGSFPSQRPFIFTEDDYRRYPELFAPFVNLVRQSLLENVLCLIGFSGDDPNFLHWIGWVRDMLDKHSLPIYLFATSPPSLGQRALLEARQVTPVVLPQPTKVSKSDYHARYEAMLSLLAKPLDSNDSEWGVLPSIDQICRLPSKDIEERRKRLLNVYAPVAELHKTYPEWLIAPISVRRRFQRGVDAIPGFLHGQDLLDTLIKNTPHVGAAVLAEYAWHQEVLLQCLDDSLALASLDFIKSTTKLTQDSFENQKNDLKSLKIESTIEFQRRWRDLGLSLLRWARQELRRSYFDELKNTLLSTLTNDRQLHDEIIYESILFALYEGDRDIARRMLGDWNIRSSDRYMLVRKGMLLGEVGEIESGITVALNGLQQLRSNQRLHSGATQYLSQEAWACLAVSHLQKSKNWSKLSPQEEHDDGLLTEQLNQRLADLAAKGHDSQRELQQLTSALNAEVPPPFQPKTYTPDFEPGRYATTRNLGGSQEWQDKIRAAFSWLTLSDRVSLVPRINNTTFDIGSFAQAAWWVQYHDSMQRVLSVMIRSLSKDMLKPRNPNQPLHKSGWLSRYQVAKTDEWVALGICSRSLNLIERMVSNSIENENSERVISFHMEVLGRLIIRLTDKEKIYSFTERVITLHHKPSIWRLEIVWKDLSLSLFRCFSALGIDERAKIIPLIASIPSIENLRTKGHASMDNWACLNDLYRHPHDRTAVENRTEISAITDGLIKKLRESSQRRKTAHNDTATTWQKLFWLNSWGAVSSKQKKVIKEILTKKDDWPTIPNHHSWAALSWFEVDEKDADQNFRSWLLSQKIKYYASNSNHITHSIESGRIWSPDIDNYFLENWLYSLERKEWPKDDALKGLSTIQNWWNSEWSALREEPSDPDDLRLALNRRLSLFDSLLAALFERKITCDIFEEPELNEWLKIVISQSKEIGAKFFKFRLTVALAKSDEIELLRIETELVEQILDFDIQNINTAANAISFWIAHPNLNKANRPNLLIDTLSGLIAARRMPLLPWSLKLMLDVATKNNKWITESSLSLIDSGLNKLLVEISYSERPLGTGIPDDNVPTLRLSCASLARKLAIIAPCDTYTSIEKWIALAQHDPLPEMRFLEEKSDYYRPARDGERSS